MQAFTRQRFGGPEVLEPADIDVPTPAPGEVLVRVRATSINPYDWHHLRGEPVLARLLPRGLGRLHPRLRILGCDLAGRVEAVGPGVTRFAPGDDVYALLEQGGFAEYACLPEDALSPMPRSLTHEQAAAVPMAASTALLALRDDGRLRSGQHVVITGASGGVGTFAVQIADALGANVTAVCSARNVDLVRSIGAAEVVDYAAGDFTRMLGHGPAGEADLALDLAGRTGTRAWRRTLTPHATLLVAGGPPGRWLQPMAHVIAAAATGPLGSLRIAVPDIVSHPRKPKLLQAITALIDDGAVTPVIDRTYAFEDLPEAIRYQEQGHARGKVVVRVGD